MDCSDIIAMNLQSREMNLIHPEGGRFEELIDLLAESVDEFNTEAGLQNLEKLNLDSWISTLISLLDIRLQGQSDELFKLFNVTRPRNRAKVMMGILRYMDSETQILRFFRYLDEANTVFSNRLRDDLQVVLGRMNGIIGVRGGWYQVEVARFSNWQGLRRMEVRLPEMNLSGQVRDWAVNRANVKNSHYVVDIITSRKFPYADHPKAGKILEIKSGPSLDEDQVMKYFGLYENQLEEVRFVLNIPVDSTNDLLQNARKIWGGLKNPIFEDHPHYRRIITRLLDHLDMSMTYTKFRNKDFLDLTSKEVEKIFNLIIEYPKTIPVRQTTFPIPGD